MCPLCWLAIGICYCWCLLPGSNTARLVLVFGQAHCHTRWHLFAWPTPCNAIIIKLAIVCSRLHASIVSIAQLGSSWSGPLCAAAHSDVRIYVLGLLRLAQMFASMHGCSNYLSRREHCVVHSLHKLLTVLILPNGPKWAIERQTSNY